MRKTFLNKLLKWSRLRAEHEKRLASVAIIKNDLAGLFEFLLRFLEEWSLSPITPLLGEMPAAINSMKGTSE